MQVRKGTGEDVEAVSALYGSFGLDRFRLYQRLLP